MKKSKILSLLIAVAIFATQFAFLGGNFAAALGPDDISGRADFMKGVNIHNDGYAAYSDTEAAINDAQALGANYIRINFDPVTYTDADYEYLDSVVSMANNVGMDVMLVLDGFSNYLKANGTFLSSIDHDAIAEQYSAIGEKYADSIKYFQIGNELDNVYITNGSLSDSSLPSGYSDLKLVSEALVTAITALKESAPDAKTIINIGWWHVGFLTGIMNNGVDFDIVGLDWYSDMSNYASTHNGTDYNDLVNYISASDKQIIITETGLWSTGYDSDGNVEYVKDEEWLADFYAYAYGNEDILGFFVYELYDEPAYEAEGSFEKESHFGLIDKSGNKKLTYKTVQMLYNGSYSTEANTIPELATENGDIIGGKPFSEEYVDVTWGNNDPSATYAWSADFLKQSNSSGYNWSKALYIEFDIYIQDIDALKAVSPDSGNAPRLDFFLYSSTDIDRVSRAEANWLQNYITKTGWNHVVLPRSAFGEGDFGANFSFSDIKTWQIAFNGNNRDGANQLYNQRVVVANVIAVKELDNNPPPEAATENGDIIGGKPFSEEYVDVTWGNNDPSATYAWSQDYLKQTYEAGYNWNKALYIEFDIYIQDIDALKAVSPDSGNAPRLDFLLYSSTGLDRASRAEANWLQNYITKTGWNHVVLPRSAFGEGDFGANFSFSDIKAWQIAFNGNNRDGANQLYNHEVKVANVMAVMEHDDNPPPEAATQNGDIIGGTTFSEEYIDVTWGNNDPSATYAWSADFLKQSNSSGYNWSKALYIEFDIYIQDIDALKAVSPDSGNAPRLDFFLYSSTDIDRVSRAEANWLQNYITKTGWNHVVLPRSAFGEGDFGANFSFSDIKTWQIAFNGSNLDSANQLYNHEVKVANVMAVMEHEDNPPPEAGTKNGDIIGGTTFSEEYIDVTWGNNDPSATYAWSADFLKQTYEDGYNWSAAAYIEFDIYIQDIDALKAVSPDSGNAPRLDFFLYSSTDIDRASRAEANWLQNYITKTGWNHVVLPRSAFGEGDFGANFSFSDIKTWQIAFNGNNLNGANQLYNHEVKVANVMAVKEKYDPLSNRPELNPVMGVQVGEVMSNEIVDTTWGNNNANSTIGSARDRIRQLKCRNPTNINDWSQADYIEFDIYIEDIDNIKALIQKYGNDIYTLRIQFDIYGADDWNDNDLDNKASIDLFPLENYITQSGWNHVVLSTSKFEKLANFTPETIQSWRLGFGGTAGIDPMGSGLCDDRVIVTNMCATKMATPSLDSENGVVITGKPLVESKFNGTWGNLLADSTYASTGDYVKQIAKTSYNYSNADYIEFDIWVESYDNFVTVFGGENKGKLALDFMLYSSNDFSAASVITASGIEAFITGNGWNRITLPVSSFANAGQNFNFSNIQAWAINFSGDNATLTSALYKDTVKVCNVKGVMNINIPEIEESNNNPIDLIDSATEIIFVDGIAEYSLTKSLDLSEAGVFEFDLYIANIADFADVEYLEICFYSGDDINNYMSYPIDVSELSQGWNRFAFRISDGIEDELDDGDFDWTNVSGWYFYTDTEGFDATCYVANARTSELLVGDANRDGKVDIRDLVRMKKQAAGKDTGNPIAADVDSNNAVDSADLIKLRRYLLGDIADL